ncbi:MAG: hypothetical protein L3J07_03395 [Candidatus Magasanikbacteria bacterium]|nr:hypothetical protein [Candidatus Magasanikbacteria bacterium]
MLSKVMKKMMKEKSGRMEERKNPDDTNKKYPTSNPRMNAGFHVKPNSQKGAERQRSIGNRSNKPAR